MIFNVGGNSEAVNMTADKVKYNDGDVAQELATLDQSVAVLEDELTANGKRIYLDYKDGRYGYNTDALRGADTFSPFRTSGSSESEFTNLTTVEHVLGTNLPTIIEGNGYLVLRRTGGTNGTDNLSIYIDNNTMAFPVISDLNNRTIGGYYKFYFQKKIQIVGGTSTHTYFYQTLLSDKPLEDKYIITQGGTMTSIYTEVVGKGKILISPHKYMTNMFYSVDNDTESRMDFYGNQYMEFNFTKKFRFMTESTDRLYYIAYTEI